jgi:hypothetical protein
MRLQFYIIQSGMYIYHIILGMKLTAMWMDKYLANLCLLQLYESGKNAFLPIFANAGQIDHPELIHSNDFA